MIAAARPRGPRLSRSRRRRLLPLGTAGAAAGWLLADRWGIPIGLVAGLVAAWRLPESPPKSMRLALARANADLPFAADLLAAALRAGATPEGSVRLVATALAGPLGDRLARVERALRLGAPAGEAWSYLDDVDGAERLQRAAERSGHSGAGFAGALQRVAEELRADRLLAAEAAGRRAGVLIVLPLGLCFLPAFVLTGLVPVIAAVLGGVLTTP